VLFRSAGNGRVFPGLFVWLVASSQENMAEGFARAADIFQRRAANRADTLLIAALPVAVLLLGGLILLQLWGCFIPLVKVLSVLGK
jgi:type II secretory pathway component PulF